MHCYFQVHYYVQSHIQINEYRDRVVLVSFYRIHNKAVFTYSFIFFSFAIYYFFYLYIFSLVGSKKKAWQAYKHVHQSFGYDWFKAFSTWPNEGTSFLYFPSLEIKCRCFKQSVHIITPHVMLHLISINS